jgi:Fic family protein
MVEDTDDRERTDAGQYAETVSTQEVREAVENGGHVVTAGEITDVLDTSRDTVLRRLRTLHENGEVERKEVGARAVVWWVNDADDH